MPVCILLMFRRSKACFRAGPIRVRPWVCKFFNSFTKVAWLSFHPAWKSDYVAIDIIPASKAGNGNKCILKPKYSRVLIFSLCLAHLQIRCSRVLIFSKIRSSRTNWLNHTAQHDQMESFMNICNLSSVSNPPITKYKFLSQRILNSNLWLLFTY